MIIKSRDDDNKFWLCSKLELMPGIFPKLHNFLKVYRLSFSKLFHQKVYKNLGKIILDQRTSGFGGAQEKFPFFCSFAKSIKKNFRILQKFYTLRNFGTNKTFITILNSKCLSFNALGELSLVFDFHLSIYLKMFHKLKLQSYQKVFL